MPRHLHDNKVEAIGEQLYIYIYGCGNCGGRCSCNTECCSIRSIQCISSLAAILLPSAHSSRLLKVMLNLPPFFPANIELLDAYSLSSPISVIYLDTAASARILQ